MKATTTTIRIQYTRIVKEVAQQLSRNGSADMPSTRQIAEKLRSESERITPKQKKKLEKF